MKIATWNINGIKARHDNVVEWLRQAEPDIACLQEIKSMDENFPREAIEDLGYAIETHGQKGFNGVAILSKLPIEEVNRGLPLLDNDPKDDHARFIEAVVMAGEKPIRVVSLYLPNGNPVDSDKYPYKLRWMERLIAWAAERLMLEEPLVLAGDYNIIPMARDARHPEKWKGDALFRPESRARYRALCNLGFTEAVRAASDSDSIYTFWDFQGGAWQKDDGIRIDHLLLSPEAADRFVGAAVDKQVRAWEKPSDHVPVWVELAA